MIRDGSPGRGANGRMADGEGAFSRAPSPDDMQRNTHMACTPISEAV